MLNEPKLTPPRRKPVAESIKTSNRFNRLDDFKLTEELAKIDREYLEYDYE